LLADDHPDKIAACVRAAETWAQAGDNLEDELRREVESARKAHKRLEDEEFQASAAAHRRTVERRYGRISTSFEERRRRQLDEAAKPRPSDYKGGPVSWNEEGPA
jgi:hypothetical protein